MSNAARQTVITFRRVLYERAPRLIAQGWEPAARHGDALGVDPFADYTQGSVLLWTEGDKSMDADTVAIERIAAMLEGIGKDELRVIELIIKRMRHGRQQYGALDIHGAKDWTKEASEELLDAVAYLAMQVTRESSKPDERK
jgi:hypothetical protein